MAPTLYTNSWSRALVTEWYLAELGLLPPPATAAGDKPGEAHGEDGAANGGGDGTGGAVRARLVTVDMQGGEHKGDEFRKLNPFARLPTLVDGDLVLYESGAVMMYLSEAYTGQARYATAKGRAAALKWVHFANTTLADAFFNDKESARTQSDVLQQLDAILARREWLGAPAGAGEPGDDDGKGEFGVADVAVGATLQYAGAFLPAEATHLAEYPRIMAYVAKINARPAAQGPLGYFISEWNKKFGPDAAAAPAAAAGAPEPAEKKPRTD